MSKERLIGKLLLTVAELPNERVSELIEQAVLLSGDNGPAWKALLKRTRVAGLPDQPPAPKLSALKPVNDNIQLDGIMSYDPSNLKTRPGLWVSDDFVRLVRSKAKPIKILDPCSLRSFDLIKRLHDREITPELGEASIFDESELCAYIDQMISRQPNGEEGDLLTNGYANLFYVAGCVVRVYWDGDGREWYVHAWELDGAHWHAGFRAFSSN